MKTVPLKYLARITLGKMLQASGPREGQEVRPYLKSLSVTETGLDTSNLPEMPFSASEQKNLDLRRGDVVVVEGGSIGRSAYLDQDLRGIHFQNSINRVRPNREVDGRFINYCIIDKRSSGYFEAITNQATIRHLTAEKLARTPIPLCGSNEQRLIADYLDRETAEIDAFMVDCSSMVTLLEEQELALEASLLTRGLNSSVSVIKDHGILWLEGESIPTHWTRMKLGFLLRMKSGDAISSEDIEAEGPYPVFGGGGFRGYTSTWNITGSHVLIGRQGALCGKVFVSAGDAFATEHAIVTYPKIDLDLRWLEGLLRFMNLGQYSQSAAQPGIGVESISKLYVPVPPLSEQVEIGASLADHQAKRSSLLLELQSAITLAHERRGALISAAVTGQIDVSTEGMSAAEQLRDDLEVHL